jgi:hypothetical protein
VVGTSLVDDDGVLHVRHGDARELHLAGLTRSRSCADHQRSCTHIITVKLQRRVFYNFLCILFTTLPCKITNRQVFLQDNNSFDMEASTGTRTVQPVAAFATATASIFPQPCTRLTRLCDRGVSALDEAGRRHHRAGALPRRHVAGRRRLAAALLRQVDVLQLQLPARHGVAARDADGLLRRGRAPDVHELHLTYLHRPRLDA